MYGRRRWRRIQEEACRYWFGIGRSEFVADPEPYEDHEGFWCVISLFTDDQLIHHRAQSVPSDNAR